MKRDGQSRPNERVMVFIDGSNLYYSMRDTIGDRELDYEAFVSRLVGDRRLVRTYFYDSRLNEEREPKASESQRGFFDYLQTVPRLELRLQEMKYGGDNGNAPGQKAVDVSLAVDLVRHALAGNCDTVLLVSGDTDFLPAVQVAKDAGCAVEVAVFGGPHASIKLRACADAVIELDKQFLLACLEPVSKT